MKPQKFYSITLAFVLVLQVESKSNLLILTKKTFMLHLADPSVSVELIRLKESQRSTKHVLNFSEDISDPPLLFSDWLFKPLPVATARSFTKKYDVSSQFVKMNSTKFCSFHHGLTCFRQTILTKKQKTIRQFSYCNDFVWSIEANVYI